MADVEEPRFTTLAERIAALNQQKNFNTPPPGTKRPPPPPPNNKSAVAAPKQPPAQFQTNGATPKASFDGVRKAPTMPARPSPTTNAARPSLPPRTSTADVQQHASASSAQSSRTLVPPLPNRRSSQQLSPSPNLPPRRPSTQSSAQLASRRNSNESDRSFVSTMSGLSLTNASSATSTESQANRKLPPTLEQAKLPPLPPSRREREVKAQEAAAHDKAARAQSIKPPPLPSRSSTSSSISQAVIEPARPSLPPRLPSRPTNSQAISQASPALPARRLPPPAASNQTKPRSALQCGFNNKAVEEVPPPVPLASRPTFDQIDTATRAPVGASLPAAPTDCCMICRDFSGPDDVAAQYPLASLPRQDAVGYLAHHLCSPFSSPTDKARAIFTWCHHNIAYDVDGFFGGCIPRGQTPDQSIFSGKAVCEGYAKIYEAIALRAGLECCMIGGHGKGFGYGPLKPGERPPPRNATGHAWNAVRIDGGEWKLLDACWGAGNVCDKRAERYEKKFDPSFFIMDNDEFGRRHFPEDDRHFYRSDGRVLPWDEYIQSDEQIERMTLYTNAKEESINEDSVTPRAKHIPVANSAEIVRFQFGRPCEHWTEAKHGNGKKPLLLFMKIHGLDGRKEDFVPLNYDGFWWWVDIPARDLGAPGQQLMCYALDTLNNRPARGVSAQEFLSKKGKCSMSWVGIAAWQLV